MNSSCPRFVVAALLSCLGAHAQATPLNGTFTVGADETGGRSLDVDLSLAAGEHVTLTAGAGRVEVSQETADLSGTLLDAGVALRGKRGGMSLTFDSFADDSNYQSRTLGARAWFSAGNFEIALLGRRRDLDVDVTLDLPLRVVTREVHFAALGGGLEVSLTRATFSAYASALVFDFELANPPQLTRRPRLEALVGTFLTQAQGAVDRQFGVGVERAFGRHSVALDVASLHDAILDAGSVSFAVTWRLAQSAHVDWGLTAGLVDSDTCGNIGFLSAAVGIGN